MREKPNSRYYKLADKPKERGQWAWGRKGIINFKIMSIDSYESQWVVHAGQEEISLQTGSWKSFVKLLPKGEF